MKRQVVALYHNPWPLSPLDRPRSWNPIALYRYAVWYKANPRNLDYMRDLLSDRLPEAAWVTTAEPDWTARIAAADEVVLLYPDAIGLGFLPIERMVMRCKRPWAAVTILNGRRRKFLLNHDTRWALRFRRLLEWTMLPELLFLPVFMVVTPLLWLADLLRGRT